MMLDVGTRSHVKHLLQHIPVGSLETSSPPLEVKCTFARSDRSRAIIILELGGEMEVCAAADKLFHGQCTSKPPAINSHTSASKG